MPPRLALVQALLRCQDTLLCAERPCLCVRCAYGFFIAGFSITRFHCSAVACPDDDDGGVVVYILLFQRHFFHVHGRARERGRGG